MKVPGSFRELSDLIVRRMMESEKRLFLLDFDGTLVDIADEVAGAVPSDEILKILNHISGIPCNHLVIITGRSRATIEHLFGSEEIDIVSEHGAIIREKGIWKDLADRDISWKEKIIPVIEKVTKNLPGSVIEEKQFSVAWHYRNADNRTGKKVSADLLEMLGEPAASSGLSVTCGKKVIEIMSNKINKGQAARYLTEKNSYDFILSVGDDTTDEEMFRILAGNHNAYTVRVGSGETLAKFSLDNLLQVKNLLVNLAGDCEDRVPDLLENGSHEN